MKEMDALWDRMGQFSLHLSFLFGTAYFYLSFPFSLYLHHVLWMDGLLPGL